MDQPKYRAFISYSHRDAKWGDWLHKVLESYRPPRQLVGVVTARGPVPKRLTPVFRDREELASATDLGTLLTEALWQSACQIVICSRQSAKSRWVNEEILAFKRLGREDRIFCLIVDADSRLLLGAAILGLNGDEVVHGLLDVMAARQPYTAISRTVHIHPTVSELVPTMLQQLRPLQ